MEEKQLVVIFYFGAYAVFEYWMEGEVWTLHAHKKK
jgi:hypothetical protein